MARKDTRTVATGQWTDPQDGTTVTGTVIKQNGTSVYVQWREGRIERVSRSDPSVTFRTAAEDNA